MKTFKTLMVMALAALLTSCGATAVFPVSSIAPAADIVAKKTKDSHDNYVLEITAKNLASPDRLEPAGSNYSVWIVTKERGVKNVGQLNVKNAKKLTYKTAFPFEFDEVFITVENEANLPHPTGAELSRTKI